MYVIPPLRDDELFESWLIKICLYNDSKLPFKGRNLNIGDIKHLKSRDILKICEILSNYSDFEFMSIINKHTLYPLITPFTDSIKRRWEEIKMNYLEYLDNAKTYHREYFNICNYRVCSHCIEEELNSFGVPYIHRTHQVPLSFFCLKHNCKLNVLDRSFSSHNIWLNDNFTEIEEINDKYINKIKVLSEDIHYVVNGALSGYTIDYIKMVLWIAMAEKGYINNITIKDKFYKDFHDYYTYDFLFYLENLLESVKENLFDFKKLILTPGAKEYSPIQIILIIRMLFEGGLREFITFSRRQSTHKLLKTLNMKVNVRLDLKPEILIKSMKLYEYLLKYNIES